MARVTWVPPSRCTFCRAPRRAPEALAKGCPLELAAMSTPGIAVVLMSTLPWWATTVPAAGPPVVEVMPPEVGPSLEGAELACGGAGALPAEPDDPAEPPAEAPVLGDPDGALGAEP